MSVDLAGGGDSAAVAAQAHFLDQANWHGFFAVEKWSEEAVEFAAKRLEGMGISHLPCGLTVVTDGGEVDKEWSQALDTPVITPITVEMLAVKDGIPSSVLRLLMGECEEYEETGHNLFLNAGIQRIWDVTIGAVTTNLYTNGNSRTGVGDSTTAEAATQTDLQAATNKTYKAMNATFPSRASQTVSFVSDYTTSDANYAWQEFVVDNGATSTARLNRKVTSLGTKASGTWTLTCNLTIA